MTNTKPVALAVTVVGMSISLMAVGAHYYGKLKARLDSHGAALVEINETLSQIKGDIDGIKGELSRMNHNPD